MPGVRCLLYAALGGALALALIVTVSIVGGYAASPTAYLAREREVLAAAGIAGGFVYWLFAGRTGRLLEVIA